MYSARAWQPNGELLVLQTDLGQEEAETEWSWWTTRIVDDQVVERQPLDAPPVAYDDDVLEERLEPWLSATAAEQAWSEDGQWLVFRAQQEGEQAWRIYAFQWEAERLVGPLADGTDLALSPVRSEWRCPV
jgi:hypothetical protein